MMTAAARRETAHSRQICATPRYPLADVFKAGLSGANASIVDGRTQSVQIAIPVHLQQLVKGIVQLLSRVRIPTHQVHFRPAARCSAGDMERAKMPAAHPPVEQG
jgi:hypothetical protein